MLTKMMKIICKLIMTINENPGMTSTELSQVLLLKKASTSIYLKKLKNNKLIERYNIDRKLKIHPTKKGKDIYLVIKKEKLFKIEKKEIIRLIINKK